MKKFIILIFVLFIPFSAFAGDWTKEDTYRELTFGALLIMDYGQTMNIAKHPDRFREHNPILGTHPSQSAVNLYMISAAVIHPIVSYYLPPKYRKIWQYVTIGLEAGSVAINASLGIGFSF